MRNAITILFILLVSWKCGEPNNQNEPTHKNIILIIMDDVGYEALTCDGGGSYETPNIDAMAANGIRYTQCHGSPLCSPSRFMLYTGKYNFRNYTQWGNMDLGQKTFANLLLDSGYSTCFAGKWQLGGGDTSIRTFGWGKYMVWDAGNEDDGGDEGSKGGKSKSGSRYKNPKIYQNGAFLADSLTLNKYADDMFTDYIASFVDTVRKPYLVCYAMSLVHYPFCPTPDDSEFANWNPNRDTADTKFYPSMVKYMDKKIGQILSLADSNTVVILVGDNGNTLKIYSLFNGQLVRGGKTLCNEWGTHVPLIVRDNKTIGVDTSLISFTDFLPTIAAIAGIEVPTSYSMLDGIPFYPQQSMRKWIYYHYVSHPDQHPEELEIWVQNANYKRYGNVLKQDDLYKKNKLFNIKIDTYEKSPVKNKTKEERIIDSAFKAIIDSFDTVNHHFE